LVPFTPVNSGDSQPLDPQRFSNDLARGVNDLLASPSRAHDMGVAARKRVEQSFSWKSIARQTLDFYEESAAKS
jgi:starch synthase